jgi:hypothetical protein
MSMKQRIFISHAARHEVEILRKLVQSAGASVDDSYGVSDSKDILKRSAKSLASSDAMIAVLGKGTSNVLFEIGLAVGLGKPIFLLLEPGTNVPPFVPPSTFLSSDLTDSAVLRLGIKQFLVEISKPSAKGKLARETPRSEPAGELAVGQLIKKLKKLRAAPTAEEVESVAGELLQAANAGTVEQHRGGDPGVDFAVWSDALAPSLGNPILVQVKAAELNEMSFRVAYSRLVRQVQDSEARAGLFLYLDTKGRRFARPATWVPYVLLFDLEDFAIELSSNSFAKLLTEHRNKAVHGLTD